MNKQLLVDAIDFIADEIYAMINHTSVKTTVPLQYEIKLTHAETNLPLYLDARSIERTGVELGKEVLTYLKTNDGLSYKVAESIDEVKRIRDEALGLTGNKNGVSDDE